jgi:hypothetical protein
MIELGLLEGRKFTSNLSSKIIADHASNAGPVLIFSKRWALFPFGSTLYSLKHGVCNKLKLFYELKLPARIHQTKNEAIVGQKIETEILIEYLIVESHREQIGEQCL